MIGVAERRAEPSEWEIRPYRAGDERQLVRLFQRVFDRPITEDHWRWKLNSRPSPVDNVWLAARSGTPVFHYGGIPCRFRTPAGERIAMVSVDAMTAPEFRRRGLLTEVGRIAFDRWRRAGIPFTLGLPNEQWGSRIGALGWQPLFPLQWLVRPLRPSSLLFGRRLPATRLLGGPLDAGWNLLWAGTGRSGNVSVQPVDRAGPEFDRLWERCGHEFTVTVVRDREWVEWRYLSAPSLEYRVTLATRAGEPVGYLAYRIRATNGRRLGFIADVFTSEGDPEARRALIRSALEAMRGEAVDAALALAIPATSLSRALRRTGFLFRRDAFTVHVVPFDAEPGITVLRDPRSWYLAGGDFDVV